MANEFKTKLKDFSSKSIIFTIPIVVGSVIAASVAAYYGNLTLATRLWGNCHYFSFVVTKFSCFYN